MEHNMEPGTIKDLEYTIQWFKESETVVLAVVEGFADIGDFHYFMVKGQFIDEGRMYLYAEKPEVWWPMISHRPKIGVSAVKGEEWLRVLCSISLVEDTAIKEAFLAANPELAAEFKADDKDFVVMELKDGDVAMRLKGQEIQRFSFK